VLLFTALFAAPWPGRLGPYWPGAFAPWQQIVVGGSIIVLHALAGRRAGKGDFEEAADANYFLGFLMTMLFLVFGLMASEGGIDAAWLSGFVADLGVGLSFTVVGLTVRQLEVLRGGGRNGYAGHAVDAGRAAVAPQGGTLQEASRIADAARVLESEAQAVRASAERIEGSVRAAAERIEGSLTGVSRGARELAAERMAKAVLGFEDRVRESAEKLTSAIDDLTAATVRSAVEIEGASSALRTGLHHDLEALAHEVSRVVVEVGSGRERLFELLRATSAEAEETQRLVTATTRSQASEWESQIRASQAHMMGVRAAVEEECRHALVALERSSGSLLALGDAVLERVNRLPDPSTRLEGIWTNVGAQEEKMVASITRAAGALDGLGRASAAAADRMQGLDAGVAQGARSLEESTAALRSALARDVEAVHRLVDELYAVIEGRINLVGRS
jgi:hypothetical protein